MIRKKVVPFGKISHFVRLFKTLSGLRANG